MMVIKGDLLTIKKGSVARGIFLRIEEAWLVCVCLKTKERQAVCVDLDRTACLWVGMKLPATFISPRGSGR